MAFRGEIGLILRLLSELGFRATPTDDGRIRVESGGLAATMMVYADPSLSLRCSVSGNRAAFSLEDVNEANHELRFGKFSLEGPALLLECDFVFDHSATDAKEQLARIMAIWAGALDRLKALVALSLQPA